MPLDATSRPAIESRGFSGVIAPLFVPASRPERFVKAAAAQADAIILDLEDAVPPDAKPAARDALRADFADVPVLVRVNAIGTPWHEADVAAVLSGSFAGIILPKAETSADFDRICRRMADARLPVLALIETANGLAAARAIADVYAVTRLIFGSIDYCADLGCLHTRDALSGARQELVLASRLAGLNPPIDGVTPALGDTDLIHSDAVHARELGFGGKLAIHPAQLPPILRGFTPTAHEEDWARDVLSAGEGAVAVRGTMVDKPVRTRARALLARLGATRRGA
jgi:citrate lyase subunit beta/citryl-CoA lyase